MLRGCIACALVVVSGCAQLFGLDRVPPSDGSGANGVCAFRSVLAGRMHSCAVDARRGVWCWGRNGGQLGLGDTVARAVPTDVTLPAAATAIAISEAGGCAQLTTGAVYCWGEASLGQMGNGETPASVVTPTAIDAFAGADQLDRGALGGERAAGRGGVLLGRDQSARRWRYLDGRAARADVGVPMTTARGASLRVRSPSARAARNS